MLRINVAWKQIEEVENPVSSDLISAMDGCFENVTLKSGEQVRPRVKGEQLLKFVADPMKSCQGLVIFCYLLYN
jgi:hypothetical protein